MALTIGITWLINSLFLESYYKQNKKNAILRAYNEMKNECETGDIASEEYDLMLQKYSGEHNVSIVIVSSIYEPVKIYANEPHDQLMTELRNTLRGKLVADKILEETGEYVLIQKHDTKLQTDFLEMCGILPNGSFFMLRTALESLKLSAGLANRFLLYVGIGILILSGIAIYFITKKLSKPIMELADISERMSEMDFTARYVGKDRTELALLGHSINRMSSNLEKAISDLKFANDELQKDNELKTKIDEMRKEFVSNVSHELKTPIALIQGYAEGLMEEVNDESERDYYCEVIIDESRKMNELVKKLLTLNHLESGDDILDREKFDIALLINNYIQSCEIITSQENIEVSFCGADSVIVHADEFLIEDVFSNLFSNAIHYCEATTKKQIDVTLEMSENKVRVTVFNTGKTIPEDALEHLFDKFYKVDKARTREYGGSGIGLSIVKAIMEAHGNNYGVTNKDNGVSFWFELDKVNDLEDISEE